MGTQLPSPKRGQSSPIFGKMPLRTEVGLGLCDIVLDGDPASPPLKGHSPPNFRPSPLWPNGWMDQDATWDGGKPCPVLDGLAAPPKRGTAPPQVFGACLLWPNGWMDEDATWYGSRSRPRHIVLDGVPAPSERGTAALPPLFGPLWPRSPISAILLSSCVG